MTTKDDVIKAVQSNHIWINAFTLIKPTDETAKAIGYEIIRMLNDKDNLLPSYSFTSDDDFDQKDEKTKKVLAELSNLTKTLYLSINAS